MKFSIILGLLLLSTISGSYAYITYLQAQIDTLKGNQITLEREIKTQNEAIKQHLSKQESTFAQIASIEAEKQEALREVNKLKQTFARHDMNDLAINKPKLMENIVNKGTKRVKDDLILLTDPTQFDEKVTTD